MTITPFSDLQTAMAELLGADAVFVPRPDEIAVEGKWWCDRDGNWSLLPYQRFIDPKGAMADRRFTGERK